MLRRVCFSVYRNSFVPSTVAFHQKILKPESCETIHWKRNLSNSFFDRFRKISVENEGDSSGSERSTNNSEDSEVNKLWLEAMKTCEQNSLVHPQKDGTALNAKELRKLKKQAFLWAIQLYLQRYGATKRNFTQFALNAMDQMAAFEVDEDLESYKAVLRVFPTGRMVVTSFLQAEWGHFHRQQKIVIQLMQKMGENHVLPDDEVGQMIINIFGWRNHAMRHYRHLMYWMPKLYHANPWPVSPNLKDELDSDPVALARAIAERICPDQSTEFLVVKLSDHSSDQPESIISAQSPVQRAHLSFSARLSQKSQQAVPIYLDGPNFVWYSTLQVAYYTLWTELNEDRLNREKRLFDQRVQFRSELIPRELPVVDYTHGELANQLDEVFPPTVPPQVAISSAESTDLVRREPPISLAVRVSKAEPEFDNRWSVFRQSHEYHFLPDHLTEHEQVEGNILAVGVVTPNTNALINQRKFFNWKTMSAASVDHSVNGNSNSTPLEFDPVPSPASSRLLRQWLRELQQSNPDLASATVVMRTPFKDSEEMNSTQSTRDHRRATGGS